MAKIDPVEVRVTLTDELVEQLKLLRNDFEEARKRFETWDTHNKHMIAEEVKRQLDERLSKWETQ